MKYFVSGMVTVVILGVTFVTGALAGGLLVVSGSDDKEKGRTGRYYTEDQK